MALVRPTVTKRRLKYSLAFKLKVVKFAKEHGNKVAARAFGPRPPEHMIRAWRLDEDNLRELMEPQVLTIDVSDEEVDPGEGTSKGYTVEEVNVPFPSVGDFFSQGDDDDDDDDADSDTSDCSYISGIETEPKSIYRKSALGSTNDYAFPLLEEDEHSPIMILEQCGIFAKNYLKREPSAPVCEITDLETINACCDYLSDLKKSKLNDSALTSRAKFLLDHFVIDSCMMWSLQSEFDTRVNGLAIGVKGKKIISYDENEVLEPAPYIYILNKIDAVGNTSLFRDVFVILVEQREESYENHKFLKITTYNVLSVSKASNDVVTSCLFCLYDTEKASSYKRHIKSHMRSRTLYICDLCWVFRSRVKAVMQRHVVNHDSETSLFSIYQSSHGATIKTPDVTAPQKLKCPHCPYTTCITEKLKSHILSGHKL